MPKTAKPNRRRVKTADAKVTKTVAPKFAPSEDYIQPDMVLGNVHIELVTTDGDVPYLLVAVPVANNADATVTDKGNTLAGTTGGWKKLDEVPGLSLTVAAVLSNKRK